MKEKVQKATIRIQQVFFVIAMAFLLGILAANVFMRYTMGKPIIWSEEIASLLQGGLAFLGIGYCFARGKHIELTLLYNYLPRRLQALCDILTRAIILFCIYHMAKAGFTMVARQMIPLGTVSWLKIGYFQAMVPIGLVIGGVYILADLIDAFGRLFWPDRKTGRPQGRDGQC